MKSLKELYKIGAGPSSSHTMGPEKACKLFKEQHSDVDKYIVTLYGSLAMTGEGHGTDLVIKKTLSGDTRIVFDKEKTELPHENTMVIEGYYNNCLIDKWTVLSIGGGDIEIVDKPAISKEDVYALSTYSEIANYCTKKHIRIPDYVYECESGNIFDYLLSVWEQMKCTIDNGLNATGTIRGGLNLTRKARLLYSQHHIDESPMTRENRLVCSYAYACSEENATGGTVVTAPTCGSCGILPAVLKYMQIRHKFSDEQIVRALATAGIIGNIVKTNASISGAECGCQAEVGTACSMAAAALAELFEMDLDQIEYAAEVAMEHHLGLTCDPIKGLVQIPCIERNAVAAMRAINALSLANFLTHTRKISFDMVVETMYETGKDLLKNYRETSQGGLAKLYK